jgi:hypothetical protein
LTTSDATIITDRYTSPARPPQVIDHQGAGWTAAPAGTLVPGERGLLTEDEESYASDYTVAVSRRESNSLDYRRRLTIEGAYELADQLQVAARACDQAKVSDNRPANNDMLSGPMANSMLRPMGDEGVEPGSPLEQELNATLPDDVRTTVAERASQLRAQVRSEGGELVLQFYVRRDMLTDHRAIVNEAERLLTKGEHPVAPGVYVLTFPPAAGPDLEPCRIDLRPVEDYRTAGSSPSFSRQEDDDVVPPLGRLIMLAESFMSRLGQSGSITLARHEDGTWVGSITSVDKNGLGTGATAADALRAVLNELGESV